MKKVLIASVAAGVLLAAGAGVAGPLRGHPNLKAAESLIRQAQGKLDASQAANEFDLGGHAQKAKELLEQAHNEIVQAAEAANADHR